MNHELELDVRFWDDVKSGKTNFVITRPEWEIHGPVEMIPEGGMWEYMAPEEFKTGDTLEMKAYREYETGTEYQHKQEAWNGIVDWANCDKEDADTIRSKVTEIISAEDFNDGIATVGGMGAHSQTGINLDRVEEVLKDCFGTNRLPDNYVVLGIEV